MDRAAADQMLRPRRSEHHKVIDRWFGRGLNRGRIVQPGHIRALFSFAGKAGQRITAQITQATWPARASGSALSVVNAGGAVIGSTPLSPNGTLAAVRLPVDGTYRLVTDLAGTDTGNTTLIAVDWSGAWSGTVYQPGFAPYGMSLNLRLVGGKVEGTVDWPDLGCGGTTAQVSRTATVLVIRESLTHGTGCVATNDWTFTKLGSGPLSGFSAPTAAVVDMDPVARSQTLATGDHRVNYGALATVTISGNTTSGFTLKAKTPVRVTGGTCNVPPGTVLATFPAPANKVYSGTGGLFNTSTCAKVASTTFVLAAYGNTLVGLLRQR